VEIKRSKAKMVREDTNFCKAMADLKRHNAVSDAKALQETLEAVVAAWPNVLYLTQDELAKQIAEALETAGVRNWDDACASSWPTACSSVAHEAYTDRAAKLMRLAGVNPSKQYEEFKTVVDKFYPAWTRRCRPRCRSSTTCTRPCTKCTSSPRPPRRGPQGRDRLVTCVTCTPPSRARSSPT
jgi:hypothetical protein